MNYWNHNSAYHPRIVAKAERHRGDVLDVGCGEGLLVQRLAAVSARVVGVDPDPEAVARAHDRTAALANVTLAAEDFLTMPAEPGSYDLVTFVASIHHMDLAAGLRRARSLLRPGGEIVVVGVAANRTLADWVISGAALPAIRALSWWHRETRDIGVRVADATDDLATIRAVARSELPGCSVRRGLYYRYLLNWRG